MSSCTKIQPVVHEDSISSLRFSSFYPQIHLPLFQQLLATFDMAVHRELSLSLNLFLLFLLIYEEERTEKIEKMPQRSAFLIWKISFYFVIQIIY